MEWRNCKVLGWFGRRQSPVLPIHLAKQGESRLRSQVERSSRLFCGPCVLAGPRPVAGWSGDAPSVHEVVRDTRFGWRRLACISSQQVHCERSSLSSFVHFMWVKKKFTAFASESPQNCASEAMAHVITVPSVTREHNDPP